MKRAKLVIAVAEAERFVERAKALLNMEVQHYQPAVHDYKGGPWKSGGAPVQQGAVVRASLDLTRALADLRRPRQ